LSHKHHMSPIFVSPSIPKEILVAKPTLPETKVKKMSTATNIRPCNLALREQDSLPISKQAVHLSDPYPWLSLGIVYVVTEYSLPSLIVRFQKCLIQ